MQPGRNYQRGNLSLVIFIKIKVSRVKWSGVNFGIFYKPGNLQPGKFSKLWNSWVNFFRISQNSRVKKKTYVKMISWPLEKNLKSVKNSFYGQFSFPNRKKHCFSTMICWYNGKNLNIRNEKFRWFLITISHYLWFSFYKYKNAFVFL